MHLAEFKVNEVGQTHTPLTGVYEKPFIVSHLVQNDELSQDLHTLRESQRVHVEEELK